MTSRIDSGSQTNKSYQALPECKQCGAFNVEEYHAFIISKGNSASKYSHQAEVYLYLSLEEGSPLLLWRWPFVSFLRAKINIIQGISRVCFFFFIIHNNILVNMPFK